MRAHTGLSLVCTLLLTLVSVGCTIPGTGADEETAAAGGLECVGTNPTAVPRRGPALPAVAMPRGNPARTGEQPGPGPKANPVVWWSLEFDWGLVYSPVVDAGVIYFVVLDWLTHAEHHLYAVDAFTGSILWRVPFETSLPHAPTVVGGVVYIGDDSGGLYAIDGETGRQRWESQFEEAVTSPVVASGAVYVTSGRTLLALDAGTGREKWRYVADPQVGLSGFFGPVTLADGVIYVSNGAAVWAVFADSGRERWHIVDESDVGVFTDTEVAVANGLVFVSGSYGNFLPPLQTVLYAIDLDRGDVSWCVGLEDLALVNTAPTISHDIVYIGDDGGNTFALDATSGRGHWRFTTSGGVRDTGIGSPAVADGVLYIDDGHGTLFAVDGATGEELWHLLLGMDYSALSSPAVQGGLLYVRASVEAASKDHLVGVLFAIGGT